MAASLRSLLAGVLDYAGLFPPARLSLDGALSLYARYRREPDAWMLGRFVVPASRLAELAPLLEAQTGPGPPFAVAALGRGGSTLPDFMAGLYADLADVATFRRHQGDRVVVDVLEVRLPDTLVGPDQDEVADEEAFFRAVSAMIERDGPPALTPFYEMARDPQGPPLDTLIVAALARHNADPTHPRTRSRPGGVKLRTGGLEPSGFPTPEQVAFVIAACRDAGVPLKFTAGLHHPLRRPDPALGVTMHGFLNVFVAGVLAKVHVLAQDAIRTILEDGDAGHFAFDDGGLRWNDLRASVDEIHAARQSVVVSFGSCSFDEPREDLRKLGWL